MKFSAYGSIRDRAVVYFHGTPGAPSECSIFDAYAKKHNLYVVCLERYSIDSSADGNGYYQALADEIKRIVGDEPVDFIGFSMGAQVALIVSSLLEGQVRQLHLVSCAAPLMAGNFISSMAGGPVFRLAKEYPLLFRLLTHAQRAIARIAPGILFALFFSNTAGKDSKLSKTKAFKTYMTQVLRSCFSGGCNGYLRDMFLYVNWQGHFTDTSADVYLWHGTDDNWSPFAMTQYLSEAIQGNTKVQAFQGLSHYSCLIEAAPLICKKIDDADSGTQPRNTIPE